MTTYRTLVLAGAGVAGALAAAITLIEAPSATDGPGSADPADRPAARALAAAATDDARHPPSTAASEERAAYAQHQVMIRVAPGASIDDLAADTGATVVRSPGASGFAALASPDGALALRDALRGDPRVDRVAPMGVFHGAGDRDDPTKRAHPSQWHLVGARAPLSGTFDLSGITIAVLDSGVAYEDRSDGSGTYAQAASLADVDIVAPYDFVNGDAHANDDNQHGTHIASIIASEGAVEGVAAGATLMPLKVLDAQNSGYELDLVEAIYWAIDNGADVVNMSLSFPVGYVPSLALHEALSAAESAGVVLVAAAGNDGVADVTWPAASRAVIAVAATQPGAWDDSPGQSGWNKSEQYLAPYSNRGPMVDVSAPGGSLQSDRTEDAYMDGIVAETIAPDDPSLTGLWMYAGTSQAAAQVSAAAAILLHAGAAPDQVRLALQFSAKTDGQKNDPWLDGAGAGNLEAWEAYEAIERGKDEVAADRAYYAAVLPHFKASATSDTEECTKDKKTKVTTCVTTPGEVYELKPRAEITIVDHEGQPVEEGFAYVRYSDVHGSQTLSCEILSSDGACTVSTDKWGVDDPDLPMAFSFELTGYWDGDVMHRPGKAMFATDEGNLLLTAKEQTSALADSFLAFYFSGEEDPHYSHLAEGVAVVNSGTGLATSPMGLLFHPDVLQTASVQQDVQVDLDGTGLATSPMGFTTVRLLTIDGTGLATSPMGFASITLAAFDATGLATSPMGFHPAEMFGPLLGSGLATSPMGFTHDAILLSDGFSPAVDLSGTAFAGMVSGSGARTAEGYEVATHLAGSGAVDIGMQATTASSAPGTACAFEDGTTPGCDE